LSFARVVKLADTLALGASAARHEGSSPFPGTKEKNMKTESLQNSRIAYFDNVKFILIELVIFGHLIESLISRFDYLRALYLLLYFFHMPVFIFIAGYFAQKKVLNRRKIFENALVYLLIYIVFQIFYWALHYWLSGSLGELNFFRPYWILWFLLSLAFWDAILPFFVKLKYYLIIAFILGILVGYVDQIGYFLSLSRTIVFFPIFLLGFYAAEKKKKIEPQGIWKIILAIGVLILGYLFLYYFGADLSIAKWLYGSYSYGLMGHHEWYAGLYRFIIYVLIIVISINIMQLIPKRNTFITKLGANSLYAYVFHGMVVNILAAIGIFNMILLPIEIIELIIFGLLVGIVLSGNFFKRLSWIIVEPYKLLKKL
jgi:fucose 4-O-acetylase-like acetyltransferase